MRTPTTEDSTKVVHDGEMPSTNFTRFGLQPEARPPPEQINQLVAGLRATPGMSEGG